MSYVGSNFSKKVNILFFISCFLNLKHLMQDFSLWRNRTTSLSVQIIIQAEYPEYFLWWHNLQDPVLSLAQLPGVLLDAVHLDLDGPEPGVGGMLQRGTEQLAPDPGPPVWGENKQIGHNSWQTWETLGKDRGLLFWWCLKRPTSTRPTYNCQATGTGTGPGIGELGWEMGNREYPQSQEMTV